MTKQEFVIKMMDAYEEVTKTGAEILGVQFATRQKKPIDVTYTIVGEEEKKEPEQKLLLG